MHNHTYTDTHRRDRVQTTQRVSPRPSFPFRLPLTPGNRPPHGVLGDGTCVVGSSSSTYRRRRREGWERRRWSETGRGTTLDSPTRPKKVTSGDPSGGRRCGSRPSLFLPFPPRKHRLDTLTYLTHSPPFLRQQLRSGPSGTLKRRA